LGNCDRRIKKYTENNEKYIGYNQNKKQFLDELPHFKKEIFSENKNKIYYPVKITSRRQSEITV
jgi:hypothetical protein